MNARINALFVAGLAMLTSNAFAEEGGPHVVSLMIGPTVGLSDVSKTQFDLVQSYAYHLSGGSEGVFGGFELQEGMGSYFRFSAGARAGYDVRVSPSMPLYVAPDVRLGLTSIDGEMMFNLRFGVEGRYNIAKSFSASLRAIGPNLAFGNFNSSSWDIMAGIGYGF
jgi:hypothetical protein